MKADEYQVLIMAIEEGVAYGFRSIEKLVDYSEWHSDNPDIEVAEAKMVDAVTDSVLSWFHIERPWMKNTEV